MKLLQDIIAVFKSDYALLTRFRKLRLSVFGVLFIPAIYATIYVSSMWDPEGHARNLPVVIVNQDQGTQFKGEDVHVGRSLTDKLQSERKLGFSALNDPEEARRKVREGEFDFALLIPPDFSEKVIEAQASGVAQLTVYTSEGNNYTGAAIAKKFAPELTRQLNALLNARRWDKVSDIAHDSEIKVALLKDGVQRLNAGAHQLSEGLIRASNGAQKISQGADKAATASQQISNGAVQLSDGGQQLTQGFRQVRQGLGTMVEKLPADEDLNALKQGASSLAQGQQQLNEGLNRLDQGAGQLTEGVRELKTRSAKIPIWGGQVSEGAGKIEDGAVKLGDGLHAAAQGSARLREGSEQLKNGVVRLSDGMQKLGAGIHLMHDKMPPEQRLQQFDTGMNRMREGTGQLSGGLTQLDQGSKQLAEGLVKLEAGSQALAQGLQQLDNSIPAKLDVPHIDAEGFSATVNTRVEVAAPVANNGTAFGANFIPLSLWVGAVMTAFLFHYRKVPLSVHGRSPWGKAVGKMLIPSGIVLGQVTIMILTISLVLGVTVSHPFLLTITLVTSSIIFVSIVMALVRWLGDTGKVIAVLFLILQLSSSGAIVPIQLSGEVFQWLHPYLPFTWVVKATKAAMFDAYDGLWLVFYGKLLLTPLVLWPIATYTGRWIGVPDADYLPALDVAE